MRCLGAVSLHKCMRAAVPVAPPRSAQLSTSFQYPASGAFTPVVALFSAAQRPHSWGK